MRLIRKYLCDILVVGSGIAGISAALEAAEMGRSVIIASSASMFSGSSFYPGTWGLGLIGPVDDDDRQDLMDSIMEIGCGMADPIMVRTFVNGIRPAIDKVRRMGVQLRRANQSDQKEYIPCFDHKHRDWNGIEFASAKEVFSRRMEELGVRTLPHCELLELAKADGRVCGAVMSEDGIPIYVGCKALVLATGGYGGLFKYHLCTNDITGVGQALALKSGCRLVNMEFMQMMPGYIKPAPKTIYNEKVFRFTNFQYSNGTRLFPDDPHWRELLELRSTHGPFTSRLPSKEIDLRLFDAFLEDEQGVRATYSEEMRRRPPEFVKTYFDWLKQSKHLTMDDSIQLGIFAHAANGGILITPEAATDVPGLFACGEGTGGMHGADRIGGLSTANGLVFGGIAGRSAAVFSNNQPVPESWEFNNWSSSNAEHMMEDLQTDMFRNGMIKRSSESLLLALSHIEQMEHALTKESTDISNQVSTSRRIEAQFLTAKSILKASLLRRESRGSHYRTDFPSAGQAMAKPIVISYQNGALTAYFKED